MFLIDPIVWLYIARPAITYIPASFLGTHLYSHVAYQQPKVHLRDFENGCLRVLKNEKRRIKLI
jgi:hypothetical protein